MASDSTYDEKEVSFEEANVEFCGSLVRLDCGKEGTYQGIVTEVDPSKACIKIEKPFRNGVCLGKQVVQIPGELIMDVLVARIPSTSPTKSKEMKDGWVPVINNKKIMNILQKGQQPENKKGMHPPVNRFRNNAPSFVPLSVQLAAHKASAPNSKGKKILAITPPLPENSTVRKICPSTSWTNSQKIKASSNSTFRTTASPFVPTSTSTSAAYQKPVKILVRKKILSITPPLDQNEAQIPSTSAASNNIEVNKSKVTDAEEAEQKTDKETPVNEKKPTEKVEKGLTTDEKKQKKKIEKKEGIEGDEKRKKKKSKEGKEKYENREEKKTEKSKKLDRKAKSEKNKEDENTEETTSTKKPAKSPTEEKNNKLKKDERNKREKEKRALADKSKKKDILKKVSPDETERQSLEVVQQKMEQLTCNMKNAEETNEELKVEQQTSSNPSTTHPHDDKNSSISSTGTCFVDVGCLVTVTSANSSDIYQGKIADVNAGEHSIRLEKPLLNGRPLAELFIVISGNMMKDIRIIRAASPEQVPSDRNKMNSNITGAHPSQQKYREQRGFSSGSESSATVGSESSTPSTYLSAVSGSGTEESVEADEYGGPRTFDACQPEMKQQMQTPTPTKKKMAGMLVATPSSIYAVDQCPNPIKSNASSAASTPRQRRITCAERMIMINQRQQQTPRTGMNSGESSRTGTPTYAFRGHNQNISPRSPLTQSPQLLTCVTNPVKIFMQSNCKIGGTMTIIPARNNHQSSPIINQTKYQTGQIPATKLMLNRNPNSAKIMQKLFSPVKSDQENMLEANQQTVTGQRINVNDLLKGCTNTATRSTEPPISRPCSSTGNSGNGGFGSSMRRPLSAAMINPFNANIRDRNFSGAAGLGTNVSPHPAAPAIHSGHYKRRSPPETPPVGIPLAHQAFGEFKLFKEQQQPTPIRLQVNNHRNVHAEIGPTGIPVMDCSNGYQSYTDRHSANMMGDPLDPELSTDFDFAGNLALFDKAEFNRETEHIFERIDSGGNHSRNYRNDENVLQDSTRVISWTKSTSVDDNNHNSSSSSPAD